MARIADFRLMGTRVSAYDIVLDSHAEENAMTDTRPFDPALFAEAAIDAETAKLNAEMIRLLADQPEWWITGAETFRAMRRRGEGPFPAPVMSSRARRSHWCSNYSPTYRRRSCRQSLRCT